MAEFCLDCLNRLEGTCYTNGMFHSLGAKIFAKAAVSFAEP